MKLAATLASSLLLAAVLAGCLSEGLTDEGEDPAGCAQREPDDCVDECEELLGRPLEEARQCLKQSYSVACLPAERAAAAAQELTWAVAPSGACFLLGSTALPSTWRLAAAGECPGAGVPQSCDILELCGNHTCDDGVETPESCPADCPEGGRASRWIRICSITDAVPDPRYTGPDIDGVQVSPRGGGASFYATTVGPSAVEGGDNQFTNPNAALGPPDTTSVSIDDRDCGTDECAGFVSIGSTGHYLILGFDQDILAGDEVTVYEIGSTLSPSARHEPAKISLSFQDSSSGQWIAAAEGADLIRFQAPVWEAARANDTCP